MSDKDPFRYEALATDIAELIASDSLEPGDKIPSVRALSRSRGVSVSTVLQAYYLLEDRGLIEARPQSGFYVRHATLRLTEPDKTKPPPASNPVSTATLIHHILQTLADPNVVQLGAAVPDPALLPGRRLSRFLGRVAREGLDQWPGYMPKGDAGLRQAIARRGLLNGCRFTADEVVVTTGCMEALTLCLRAVARPGDTIAVESPTYFGILHLIASLGMKALELPTHPQYGLCLDDTRAALERTRIAALLLNPTFNNPMGSLMPEANRKTLLDLLRRYDLPLIEDDIYGDLHFDTARPTPLKAFDTDGRVLYCASFSKTVSPAYRIGFAAPGRYMEDVLQLKMASTIATSLPAQVAVGLYLEHGGYDRHLRKLQDTFRRNLERTTQVVLDHFPPETRITRPQGGFVLWLEMPAGVDALRLYRDALDRNISITPGPMFSASGCYDSCIRLSCGPRWSDAFEQALHTVGRLTRKQLQEKSAA